jgi:flavin reductase (DIM6/NTAB) family NADH-FMN oxidoreductase RutF
MQRKVAIEQAAARKYPEQVVWVVTRNRQGRANAMAVGWVAVVSGAPLMFALGIDSGAYTYDLIRKTRQFVVAYPSEAMARETLYVGSHHGHDEDKLAACGIATRKAALVKAPLLADAVANFECRLVDIYQPGDCPIAIGKVIAAHVNCDPAVRRLYTVGKGHVMAGVRVARRAGLPRSRNAST